MSEVAAPPAVIRLDQLDREDDRFAICSFSAADPLEASLSRVGILQPPWVWEKENHRYTMVDGFKRLHWACRKGLAAVPCRVFPVDAAPEQLWLSRLEGKLHGPPLNAAEKAQLIDRAAATQPSAYVVACLLPALGMPPRAEVAEQWRRLANGGEGLLRAVAAEEVGERAALELVAWGDADRAAMLQLLQELRCSVSIQMEILERVAEIALRDGRQRLAVIVEPQVLAIQQDREANRRQKTLLLRELLTQWRYPRLRAREERFACDVKALALPRRVCLHPPPAFEGRDWCLDITFSSPDELEKLLKETLAGVPSRALGALMEPGTGSGGSL